MDNLLANSSTVTTAGILIYFLISSVFMAILSAHVFSLNKEMEVLRDDFNKRKSFRNKEIPKRSAYFIPRSFGARKSKKNIRG